MTSYPRIASMLALSEPRRKGKELVLIVWESPCRLKVVCFCSRSQKHKDGGCRHTKDVLAAMKPWHRARTRLEVLAL
jgi:hypothetical protein